MDKSIITNRPLRLSKEDFLAVEKKGKETETSYNRSTLYNLRYVLKENKLAMTCMIMILLVIAASDRKSVV